MHFASHGSNVIRDLAVVRPHANMHIGQPLISLTVRNLTYINRNFRLATIKVCLCKLKVLQELHIARIH